MKKLTTLVLAFMLIMTSALLPACGSLRGGASPSSGQDQQGSEEDSSDFDDPALENEMDGAEPVPVAHKEPEFYGKWSATSDHAHDLFGNVDLEINKDKSWKGNITDEDFHGKWQYNGTGITLKDSQNLIHWDLYFVEDGTMMFRDLDDPEVDLVLKKQ